ncbi:hypothetical protein ACFVDQ_20660 [Streptomyces sp. NPDC057684]|uniref:hypothetical protein n=1 Tax=Streptomyces sp. NPDC057684 TaxID=3346211 RepID=UPI0036C009B2
MRELLDHQTMGALAEEYRTSPVAGSGFLVPRMRIERFIGIDLAWAQSGARTQPNERGVAAINAHGVVMKCGRTRGDDVMAGQDSRRRIVPGIR